MALAAPAMADDPTPAPPATGATGAAGPAQYCGGGPGPPPPCLPPPPTPTEISFSAFGEGLVPFNAPWKKNRVYFAAGLEQTRRWSRYISPGDRARLSGLNFSRSGVLAIFFAGPNGYEELSVKAIYSQADALSADILALPFCWRCTGPTPTIPPSGWGSYVLVTMERGTLQSPVPGRLYVNQLPRPDPTAPPSSEEVMTGGGINTGPARVLDWQVLTTFQTWHPDERNRIFYASVPTQTDAWRYHVYETRETRKALRQNFSRYGLLALFLTGTAAGSSIDGVYLLGNHALNVVLRAPPPPPLPPGVYCTPSPGDVCFGPTHADPTTAATFVESGEYRLLAIRKDSLPGAVKRLYITEVSE